MFAYDRTLDSVTISTKLILSISSEHFIISEDSAKILRDNINEYFDNKNQLELDI